MQLTPAQLSTLKTWIVANHASAFGQSAVDALNAPPDPDFFVFNDAASTDAIKNAIAWKKLTSAAAIPTLTGTNAADQTALLHMIAKHTACSDLVLNIQTILGLASGGTLDATKSSLRQGLKDALEAVPSVSDGTTQDAGWSGVQPLLAREASVIEKVLASGGGNGSTALLAANLGVGAGGELCQGEIDLDTVIASEAAA